MSAPASSPGPTPPLPPAPVIDEALLGRLSGLSPEERRALQCGTARRTFRGGARAANHVELAQHMCDAALEGGNDRAVSVLGMLVQTLHLGGHFAALTARPGAPVFPAAPAPIWGLGTLGGMPGPEAWMRALLGTQAAYRPAEVMGHCVSHMGGEGGSAHSVLVHTRRRGRGQTEAWAHWAPRDQPAPGAPLDVDAHLGPVMIRGRQDPRAELLLALIRGWPEVWAGVAATLPEAGPGDHAVPRPVRRRLEALPRPPAPGAQVLGLKHTLLHAGGASVLLGAEDGARRLTRP